MLAADEDALICDLVETYQIFDYRAVPVQLLARLACGLRENSRIRMILSGSRLPTAEILLAGMVDRLGQLVWMLSEDGTQGRNRPESILELLQGTGEEKEKEGAVRTFDTPAEFEAALSAAKGGEDSGN